MLPLVLLLLICTSAESLRSRIIGGDSTTIERHPYMVSIQLNNQHHCGGSLISKNWVLTAAHCVYGKKPASFKLRIGSTYTSKQGILIEGIKNVIYHEYYDDDTYEYDVALIKLPSPVQWNSHTKAVSLASSSSKVTDGSKAVVTGWGRTSVGGPMSPTMLTITLPIVSQNQCAKIYEMHNLITEEMLCAGHLEGGKDTCQGDSGSPLVYNGHQIGLVSWGAKCATPGYPGVYTRISAVRTWISKHAGI